MKILGFLFLLSCFWFSVSLVGSKTTFTNEAYCPKHQRLSIGAVIDQRSRVGKEQKIAMELAVLDFDEFHCLNLLYPLRTSAHASAAGNSLSD